jgi:putative transposase
VAPHKKNASRLGAHIAFIDESGFLLIPSIRRTWAPRGQTPITRHRYNHARISAISALTLSPQRKRLGLYFQLHQKNIQQEEACGFLRHLLRHLRGHVVVVWDNGTPHKGTQVREFCRGRHRLHLERFPAYAPELNPDEGVWSQVKGKLSNGRPDDLGELNQHLSGDLLQLRASQPRLRWCVHQSDLPRVFT